jgi:hypothetical protein
MIATWTNRRAGSARMPSYRPLVDLHREAALRKRVVNWDFVFESHTGAVATGFALRRATVADAPTIARHRGEMFTDASLTATAHGALVTATTCYLEQVMPIGEYVGWLATPSTCR